MGLGFAWRPCSAAALPAALGNCKKLRRVTCRYNKMRQFPMAITKVLSLRELQLCGNEMEGVPPEIGNLVNLRSLWITENAIKELPKELAKCEKIKELRIGLNPMIPKWRALVAAGAAQMLWTCRQMTLADERGPPPEMKYVPQFRASASLSPHSGATRCATCGSCEQV